MSEAVTVESLIEDQLAHAQLIVQMAGNPHLPPFERMKTYADACRAYDALMQSICDVLDVRPGINAWIPPAEPGPENA